ncbi:MAG TPA: TonB-dependent receptor [Opitutaceae bacterium]|nr:TonB-dependent receptor [Lacunisphaera sp.]HWA09085.1 TonB-dependent receptor [Opitutaceae bacterium]
MPARFLPGLRTFLTGTLLLTGPALLAQAGGEATVTGTVLDPAGARPVPYVAVTLERTPGGEAVQSAATNDKGEFSFEHVPFGQFQVGYAPVGADRQHTAAFALDAGHRTQALGKLLLTAEPVVKMQSVEVASSRSTFYNSIDRKVYDVGRDLQSTTGSASNLLQNVPSVDVDIEGNVSLRGDSNVLILIDGKTSTLMGANRAAVLEQMPADSIDRIEVITNPSAKYKPDGTAGIINITLKKKREPGYSGSLRVSVGNDRRYNAGLTANYNPGKYNVFGSYNIRQDDRVRTGDERRSHLDPASNTFLGTTQHTYERSRPLSHIAQAGVDYTPSDKDKLGASFSYNHRSFFRTGDQTNRTLDATGAVNGSYDRLRTDPEYQQDVELKGNYQHTFGEDHELNIDVKHGVSVEQENNHYANVYQLPVAPTSYDTTRITPHEHDTELSAEYTRPLPKDVRLESGYSFEDDKLDIDHYGASFDPVSNSWITDPVVTNRFVYESAIHAFYGTYGRPFGAFGVLAGLRVEETTINTNQATAGLRDRNQYARAYPSLHLKYDLSDVHELQLNYSHRIHRPEGDDLNPYPEYQDPFNLRAGNPHLVPEEIHSIEAGYQYKKGATNYLATVYYRYQYHGFTDVTRYVNSTTLLTTKENLANSTSGGLEATATTELGGKLSLNTSANVYYNVIDASNLGFGGNRSTYAWTAKLNASYHATKTDLIQFNTNYSARRLTAQGYRLPNFVANIGFKHDLADKKTSLLFTLSDIFDSMHERTLIDTPILHDEITRRRSARVAYIGVIYNFGKGGKKKGKDDTLPFDNGN